MKLGKSKKLTEHYTRADGIGKMRRQLKTTKNYDKAVEVWKNLKNCTENNVKVVTIGKRCKQSRGKPRESWETSKIYTENHVEDDEIGKI